MQLKLRPFSLHLRHPFTISYDSREVQQTLIVELAQGGHHGFGEATANPYYGVTVPELQTILANQRDAIEAYGGEEPEKFWTQMQPLLGHHSFAQCALDVAAHDLHGKLRGMPLHRLWGLTTEHMHSTYYTIGLDTPEKMVAKLKERPWPIYKIKLGTPDDVALVRELRRHTEAVFRVDANCAWTVAETIENAKKLKTLGVEFIEQPLRASDMDGMKEVYRFSELPLIADESCLKEADVGTCHGRFHGINIKLVKCGGLTPARRMIAEARKLGLQVMVGCMTESSVGISAIAQLLPLLDYADLDGALLLREDIATGVSIENGVVSYSAENGTGVRLLAMDHALN